jgi:hypothetical protein
VRRRVKVIFYGIRLLFVYYIRPWIFGVHLIRKQTCNGREPGGRGTKCATKQTNTYKIINEHLRFPHTAAQTQRFGYSSVRFNFCYNLLDYLINESLTVDLLLMKEPISTVAFKSALLYSDIFELRGEPLHPTILNICTHVTKDK